MAAAAAVRLRAAGTRGGRGRLLRRRGDDHRAGLPAMSGADLAAVPDLAGVTDLADIGLGEGGHVLVSRALAAVPPEVERAVVQLMTYLVENEQAALIIPARLLSQLHPHYREVMQLLASQSADEARHVEVFTRRALLSGGELGTSSAGGRASLQT